MTTFEAQRAALADRVIREALDALRMEARLREACDHAAERAPVVAAWWTRAHRGLVLLADQDGPLISIGGER